MVRLVLLFVIVLSAIPAFAQCPGCPNSVNSLTIRDESIVSIDVKDGSLTGSDLADGSITDPKLSLTAPTIQSFANAQHNHSSTSTGGPTTPPTPQPNSITTIEVLNGTIKKEDVNATEKFVFTDQANTFTVAPTFPAGQPLNAPMVTNFINSQHTHADATTGGPLGTGVVSSATVLDGSLTSADVNQTPAVGNIPFLNTANSFSQTQTITGVAPTLRGNSTSVGGVGVDLRADLNDVQQSSWFYAFSTNSWNVYDASTTQTTFKINRNGTVDQGTVPGARIPNNDITNSKLDSATACASITDLQSGAVFTFTRKNGGCYPTNGVPPLVRATSSGQASFSALSLAATNGRVFDIGVYVKGESIGIDGTIIGCVASDVDATANCNTASANRYFNAIARTNSISGNLSSDYGSKTIFASTGIIKTQCRTIGVISGVSCEYRVNYYED